MAISITAAEVKRKAGVDSANTAYDTSISSLITEMQGPLEYSIADAYIDDSSDAKLQATLKLGMLEMIAGEFVEQLRREIGATEQFGIAGLTMGSSSATGTDMIQQGATRLAPYLKGSLPMMADTSSSSSTIDEDLVFSEQDIPSASKEVW